MLGVLPEIVQGKLSAHSDPARDKVANLSFTGGKGIFLFDSKPGVLPLLTLFGKVRINVWLCQRKKFFQ